MCLSLFSRFFKNPAVILITAVMIFGGSGGGGIGMGVKLSDCTSVQKPESLKQSRMLEEVHFESIESLAASKILRDTISSSSPSSLPILSGISMKDLGDIKSEHKDLEIRKDKSGSSENDNNMIQNKMIVAQCRSSCLDKFTRMAGISAENDYPIPKTTSTKSKMNTNLLHLEGKGESSQRNKISNSIDCVSDSPECLSCWKSCQHLEISHLQPPALSVEIKTETETPIKSTTQKNNADAPFEMQLVSLFHQNSLVIAELRWDNIGATPDQEYQVTWELFGGGLKGHLVTDSTSVTLSLWPDTSYTVQVNTFQQSFLDFDGEEPPTPEEPSSQKSLPLILNTSMASFSLDHPAALHMSQNENSVEKDYEHDDDFSPGKNVKSDDKIPAHISFGEILGVGLTSLVLVLVIFTMVAFIWIKMRKMYSFTENSCATINDSESGETGSWTYFSCCSVEKKDAKLVTSQENLITSENESPTFYSSPMQHVLNLKTSQYYVKKNKKSWKNMHQICHNFVSNCNIQLQRDHMDDQVEIISSPTICSVPDILVNSHEKSDCYHNNHGFDSCSESCNGNRF